MKAASLCAVLACVQWSTVGCNRPHPNRSANQGSAVHYAVEWQNLGITTSENGLSNARFESSVQDIAGAIISRNYVAANEGISILSIRRDGDSAKILLQNSVPVLIAFDSPTMLLSDDRRMDPVMISPGDYIIEARRIESPPTDVNP